MILIVCLAAASLLFTGIVLFIVDFLLGPPAGIVAAGCVFVVLIVIWVVLPLAVPPPPPRHPRRLRPCLPHARTLHPRRAGDRPANRPNLPHDCQSKEIRNPISFDSEHAGYGVGMPPVTASVSPST